MITYFEEFFLLINTCFVYVGVFFEKDIHHIKKINTSKTIDYKLVDFY